MALIKWMDVIFTIPTHNKIKNKKKFKQGKKNSNKLIKRTLEKKKYLS